MGMSDHRVTATFSIYRFEVLGLDTAFSGLSCVNCFERAVGELEYGSPNGVTCFGSHRGERALPLPVGKREDQFRFGKVRDESEFGVRGNRPEALGCNERRIRKVQGAQVGPPRLISSAGTL